MKALFNFLFTPISWLLLAIVVLGYYVATLIRDQKNNRKRDGATELRNLSRIQAPTPAKPKKLPSLQQEIGGTNQANNAYTSQQVELLDLPAQKGDEVRSDYKSNDSERPYIDCSTHELEEIVKVSWDSLETLRAINYELGFRLRKKARDLSDLVFKRLDQLQREQFNWPSTEPSSGLQSLTSDAFRREKGLLGHYGYKVGRHGLSQNERLELLDSIFLNPLRPVEDRDYLEGWGKPGSARRLKKMAESIASFARNAKRRNGKQNLSKAIQDWEADLEYLRKKYYYNERSPFKWPHT
jgi:hypothetical protein